MKANRGHLFTAACALAAANIAASPRTAHTQGPPQNTSSAQDDTNSSHPNTRPPSDADEAIRSAEQKVLALEADVAVARKSLQQLRKAQPIRGKRSGARLRSPATVNSISGIVALADGDCSGYVTGDKVAFIRADRSGYAYIAALGTVSEVYPDGVTLEEDSYVVTPPLTKDLVCDISTSATRASLYDYAFRLRPPE